MIRVRVNIDMPMGDSVEIEKETEIALGDDVNTIAEQLLDQAVVQAKRAL